MNRTIEQLRGDLLMVKREMAPGWQAEAEGIIKRMQKIESEYDSVGYHGTESRGRSGRAIVSAPGLDNHDEESNP